MLVGTNGADRPPSEEGFARLWGDAGGELRDLGVETPEELGALFIADAATLADWTSGVPPLVDDRPGRLRPWAPPESDRAVYRGLREASACAERFRASALVRRLWPPGLRERTAAAFQTICEPNRFMKRMYRTGDVVREEGGRLYFVGRKDNQVKHMGYRIELEDIEHALVRLPQVSQAAVVYQRHSTAFGKLVGFAACTVEVDEGTLLRELATLLPDYMIPSKLS
jgi:acyl-CoA synthetase (AMP-forming)/AMP-acid ligase II